MCVIENTNHAVHVTRHATVISCPNFPQTAHTTHSAGTHTIQTRVVHTTHSTDTPEVTRLARLARYFALSDVSRALLLYAGVDLVCARVCTRQSWMNAVPNEDAHK